MKKFLWIIILVPILFILFTFTVGNSIMWNLLPKGLRGYIELFSPPKDLYGLLIKQDFNISEKGKYRIEFKNRYLGKHNVGILLKNFSSNELYFQKQRTPQLKLKLTFFARGKTLLSKIIENKYLPFIGKKESGFDFLIYECSKDLPLSETIICEIEILEPDPELNKLYGPTMIYIGKKSDL